MTGLFDELRASLIDCVDGYTLDVAERVEEVGERFHRAAVGAYHEGELFRVHYGRGARDACYEIAAAMRDAVTSSRARAGDGGVKR